MTTKQLASKVTQISIDYQDSPDLEERIYKEIVQYTSKLEDKVYQLSKLLMDDVNDWK